MSLKTTISLISGEKIELEVTDNQLETIKNSLYGNLNLDMKLSNTDLYIMSNKIEYITTTKNINTTNDLYTVEIPTFCESGNKYVLHRMYSGRICLTHCNFTGENWKDLDKYKLTEEEIKRDHEYLWGLAEKCEDNS